MDNEYPDFVEVSASGNGFERGVAHGEALREYVPAYCGPSLREKAETRPQAKRIVEESLVYIEKHWPDVVAEMRGIAHGARQDFVDVLYWNFNRLFDMSFPAACTNLALGATTVGPAVAATVDGNPPSEFGWGRIPQDPANPYPLFVQKTRGKEGYNTIATVLPGTVWVEMAMNEHGLVITQSGIDTIDSQPYGLPFHTFYREALRRCSDVDEALRFFDRHSQVFFGGDFAFLDRHGKVCRVEKSPTRQVVVPPVGNWVGTANGFTTPELQEVQNQIPALIEEAVPRRERERSFAEKVGEAATLEDLFGFIRGHGDPTPICKHGEGGIYHSSESYVLLAKERAMLVGSRGYPCQARMKEFTL